jgi:hypothetical protein
LTEKNAGKELMQGAAHNFLKISGQLEAHLGNLHGKVGLAIWQLCFVNALTTWQYRFGNMDNLTKCKMASGEVNLAK